jgi:hypothetical protein
MNLCCEADPKGKSHGCDLQRNSPSRRNKMFINAILSIFAAKAAHAKQQTSVAKFISHQPTGTGEDPMIISQ